VKLAGIDIQARGPDPVAGEAARRRQDNLAKPAGSLGRLEEISVRLCEITGRCPPRLGEKVIIVCAADHGVTEEGVSPYPSDVTAQMLLNFAGGGAAINVLARESGARVVLLNAGTASAVEHPCILDKRVRPGTANMAYGPAMTKEEAKACLLAGFEAARSEISSGAGLLAAGDMGIGNTTSASAIIAALTGRPVEQLVGRGTGLDDEGLARKVCVVRKALEINMPDPGQAMDVLAKVGGLEIGAMAGVMLACAHEGVPVVVDGLISTAAALVAERACPGARGAMFASHLSVEPGHRPALDELELDPYLDLSMRLGEGTGAALAMIVLECAAKLLADMATFEEAGVSRETDET
jgi:nicotinate-nucleotide--dimethylbenzimidazole phosphoribosyltransferase